MKPIQVGTEGNYNYMLMEFFGPNLENYMLKNGGRLDEALVLKLGVQMIERVRHIHSKGYIHRDLRP